jgi:hypothetical protein
MFGRCFEIWKQKALEKAEESEPQERTMKVLNLTEGLVVIKDGIKVFITLTRTKSEHQQLHNEMCGESEGLSLSLLTSVL